MPAMKILAPISQERSLELKTEPTSIVVEAPFNFFPLIVTFVALCFLSWGRFGEIDAVACSKKERGNAI